MAQDINKEYIKNLIINGLKGKTINKKESDELQKVVMNFNQTEWQNLKVIGKEAVKELIDEEITKSGQIPSNWQNEIKNFGHSWIDLVSELISTELILEAVRLEKAKITGKEKMKTLLPLWTKQLDKVAARKRTRKLSDSAYHSAEKSLVKKIKSIKSMGEMFVAGGLIGNKITEQQVQAGIKKIIDIFKSLSADEILVLKEKLKSLANDFLNNNAPAEFRQSPELRALANSVINFIDAFCDEELLFEGVKLTSKLFESGININFDEVRKAMNNGGAIKYEQKIYGGFIQASQKSGLENQFRQHLVDWTNHINRLASEEVNNNNISSEGQQIVQKLSNLRQLSGTNNNSTETGTGLSFVSPVNALDEIEGGNNNSRGISAGQFLSQALTKLTTVESKGKWYQNPWFIGSSIVGGLLIGGLAVWLLMRRKKEKVKVDNRRDYW